MTLVLTAGENDCSFALQLTMTAALLSTVSGTSPHDEQNTQRNFKARKRPRHVGVTEGDSANGPAQLNDSLRVQGTVLSETYRCVSHLHHMHQNMLQE